MIVLLILAATVLLFEGLAWIVHTRADAAAELRKRSVPNALEQSQLEGQKLQREAEVREAARQLRIEQKESQRLQALAAQRQAEDDRQRAEVEAADRKAKAWDKFYRKPAVCNDATTMECANAYIRAKRAFEDKYARGEL